MKSEANSWRLEEEAAARRGDDAILRQVLWEFEREGFEIEGAHLAVAGMTMSEGPMGKVRPEARHAEDITRALQVARGIGELDIGQGAVVADGLVLAVEAQEGTDAMLRRVRELPEARQGAMPTCIASGSSNRRSGLRNTTMNNPPDPETAASSSQ